MVESVKIKAEGSVFSIKKDTVLSDLIPRLNLCHELVFAKIDETDSGKNDKRRKKMGSVPIFTPFYFFKIRRFR